MSAYVYSAMSKADYQLLEDGMYYASVFLCPSVWAVGETIEECREALKDTLSQWLVSAYEDHNVPPKISDLAWLSLYLNKAEN
jgi:predicted RNase H-like HicB family nuclease